MADTYEEYRDGLCSVPGCRIPRYRKYIACHDHVFPARSEHCPELST